jgi:hypothetical protein
VKKRSASFLGGRPAGMKSLAKMANPAGAWIGLPGGSGAP